MKFNLSPWLIALSLLAAPLAAQEIYRVIDQDGNVTYTDQKPHDDATPVELPQINVLGDDDMDLLPTEQPESTAPLKLQITHPADGEIVNTEANRIEVEMDINLNIPPTAQIVLFLNGQPQEPVRSLEVILDQMPPGEYWLRAELQTPSGRKLAGSDTNGFEVRAARGDPDGP